MEKSQDSLHSVLAQLANKTTRSEQQVAMLAERLNATAAGSNATAPGGSTGNGTATDGSPISQSSGGASSPTNCHGTAGASSASSTQNNATPGHAQGLPTVTSKVV